MTREQKLTKLRNAIVAYRGIRHGVTGPWIHPPNPKKREDILKWLARLGLPPDPGFTLPIIDGFKSFDEMGKFINCVRACVMDRKETEP